MAESLDAIMQLLVAEEPVTMETQLVHDPRGPAQPAALYLPALRDRRRLGRLAERAEPGRAQTASRCSRWPAPPRRGSRRCAPCGASSKSRPTARARSSTARTGGSSASTTSPRPRSRRARTCASASRRSCGSSPRASRSSRSPRTRTGRAPTTSSTSSTTRASPSSARRTGWSTRCSRYRDQTGGFGCFLAQNHELANREAVHVLLRAVHAPRGPRVPGLQHVARPRQHRVDRAPGRPLHRVGGLRPGSRRSCATRRRRAQG